MFYILQKIKFSQNKKMQVIEMKINGKEYVIKHIIIYKLLIKLTNKHFGKF